MARRTTQDAKKTREAILDAAEKVFLSQGIALTSLEEIASKAGVTRGAVYWHFKNKIELCDALAHRLFLPHEELLRALVLKCSSSPIEDLKEMSLQSLAATKGSKKKRDVFSMLFLCEHTQEAENILKQRNDGLTRTLALTEKLFVRAYELGLLSENWTPRLAALTTQIIIIGLITGALENRKGYDLDQIGPLCVKAFFSSLTKRKQRNTKSSKRPIVFH